MRPISFVPLFALLLLGSCRPSTPVLSLRDTPSPLPARSTATTTPIEVSTSDPALACPGWSCTLTGAVVQGETEIRNAIENVEVRLSQSSYCSPTSGQQATLTDSEGRFAFDVYLHDTDSLAIRVELEGYQTAQYSMTGLDCLYCGCGPIELGLTPSK